MDASSGLRSVDLVVSSLRLVTSGASGRCCPERWGGVVEPEVYVAVLGEGDEDLQPGRRDAGGAEHGESLRAAG